MSSILADADTLMKQASMTADTYMNEAMGRINDCFGKGYAEKNPALIAEFMKVACADFNNSVLCQTLQTFTEVFSRR